MKYIIYISFMMLSILEAKAGPESGTIAQQSDCWRCTAERCSISPLLAKSCLEVCKKASSYPKIRNNCQAEGELKSAIEKSRGSRLAEIQIPEAKDLDKNDGLVNGSQLTPKGIFMLLQALKLIAPGKNPDEASQALVIKTVEAGFYSTKIYIVSVQESYRNTPESVFVIKGLKNAEKVSNAKMNTPQKEMQGLEKVQQFIVPQLKGTGVHIAETKGAFWYYDQAQFFGAPLDLKKNFVVVLGIAAGESVDSLGEKYLKGQMSDQQWDRVLKDVGEAIGKVHFALATPETKKSLSSGSVNVAALKTIIHEDLHGGNIFYDDKTHQVTLIDVASMADTLATQASPLRDISDFCSSTEPLNKKNPTGMGSFVTGYVSAFPEASQASLRMALAERCKKAA